MTIVIIITNNRLFAFCDY